MTDAVTDHRVLRLVVLTLGFSRPPEFGGMVRRHLGADVLIPVAPLQEAMGDRVRGASHRENEVEQTLDQGLHAALILYACH